MMYLIQESSEGADVSRYTIVAVMDFYLLTELQTMIFSEGNFFICFNTGGSNAADYR